MRIRLVEGGCVMTRSSLTSFGLIAALLSSGVAMAHVFASESDANNSRASQVVGDSSMTPAQVAGDSSTTAVTGTLLAAAGNEVVLKLDDGTETRFSVDALSSLPSDLAIGGMV